MQTDATELLVPCSYLRIIARELELQERDLAVLLRGTGLPVRFMEINMAGTV